MTAVLIVTYHAIEEPRSIVSVPPAELADDIEALADAGYVFVSLDQVADWLEGGAPLPARAAAITFDDGYASVARAALPILARRCVPSTVFVIAGRLGGDNRWAGQDAGVPTMALVSAEDLRELTDAGVAIGSHSMSHAVLPALPDDAVAAEISASADMLEDVTGTPVRHFAYPWDRRGAREAALVAARYRTGLGARSALVNGRSDRHALGRLDAHDVYLGRRLGVLGGRMIPPYLAVRRAGRRIRRLGERLT